MGAILAMERDGVVYLAADAVKDCCAVNYYVNSPGNLKIHKMPSGILLGAVGIMQVTQSMWLHDDWFELAEGEVFDKRFIVTKIIPKFYKVIRHMDAWEEKENRQYRQTKAAFILAKDADIFVIFDDLSVTKCDGMAALSPEDAETCLLGYVSASQEENPERLIRGAFEFASRKMGVVHRHGYVVNTRDFIFKKLEDVE